MIPFPSASFAVERTRAAFATEATRLDSGLRELLVFDAERPDEGPLATVHLPLPIVGQVHGWWVPEWQLPYSPV